MSVPEAKGILPDPRRRGEIQFRLAKSLPYSVRLAILGALLAAGFALQAAVGLLPGAACLLAASVLAVVRGFSNAPETIEGAAEWRGGSRDQLEKILEIARKSREWDRSALDITCPGGCCALIAATAVGAVVAIVLEWSGREWLASAWALDAAVLLLPHWVTGVRHVLTNDPLTIKAKQLLLVADEWEKARQMGETLLPQIQVRRGPKGEMPCDAKLLLRVERLGEAFLGLQTQVVLNRVQGSDFPYLYCVLVARRELGMADRLKVHPPEGIVAEMQQNEAEGLDILVIRQHTTSTSGYHTDDAACRRIFATALAQVRKLERS